MVGLPPSVCLKPILPTSHGVRLLWQQPSHSSFRPNLGVRDPNTSLVSTLIPAPASHRRLDSQPILRGNEPLFVGFVARAIVRANRAGEMVPIAGTGNTGFNCLQGNVP